MVEIDIYTYRELPWLSKSKILAYRFCQYLFNLRYNLGIDYGSQLKAQTGSNLHALYAYVFSLREDGTPILNYDELANTVIDYTQDTIKSGIYQVLYKTMMELIPAKSRSYEPYQRMIRNFCLLEAQHWIDLNRRFKENITKVTKYFIPRAAEQYLENEDLMIFGTLDRRSWYEDEKDIQIIYDYKTGHVPASVRKGQSKPSNAFSWTLPTSKNFELHFYLILEMTRRGFYVNPKLVDFCTNEKHFYVGAKLPTVESYFYNKDDEPIDPRDYYKLGIIYTGGEEPWVPKKTPNGRSMKSVFEWINKIRTILVNEGPYNKEPNYWQCRECNEQVRERCLTEEESKMIFWSYDDEKSEHSS